MTTGLALGPLSALILFGVARHAFWSVSTADPFVTMFALASLAACAGYFCGEIARDLGHGEPLQVSVGVPSVALLFAATGMELSTALQLSAMLSLGFLHHLGVVGEDAAPSPIAPPVPVAPPLRIVQTAKFAQASCQVCGDPLCSDVVLCSTCETPHHAECWSYAERCSTYGCGCRTAA